MTQNEEENQTPTPQEWEKIINVLNKYRKPHTNDLVRYTERFVEFISINSGELERGLEKGKYQIRYLGEYYEDYGQWITAYPEIPAYHSWKVKCEDEEGYFEVQSVCFEIKKERVIGLFRDEFIRNNDSAWIFDYYVITKS